MVTKIQEFAKHERFMIRIQSIHFIMRLREEFTKDALNKQIVEILLTLAEDPVPNIRLNIAKAIEVFYGKMTPGSKFKTEAAMKKMCNDSDFDASFFSKKALDHINKINKAWIVILI